MLYKRIVLTWAAEEVSAYLKAERDEQKALFHFTPEEWELSVANWSGFVTSRGAGSALDPGVFYTPSSGLVAEQEGAEKVGEERFSKVLAAQHEQCLICAAMQDIKNDGWISKEMREQKIKRLAHTVPKVMPFPATGGPIPPEVLGESNFEDLVNVSAWGHERVRPAPQKDPLSNLDRLREALPQANILEPKPGSFNELAERKDYVTATEELLRATSNGELLDIIIQHSENTELYRERVNVFRQNKTSAADAIMWADTTQCLSNGEKETYARLAAAVWELERDLMILEGKKEALKKQLQVVKYGYTPHPYSKGRAEKRKKFGIGYYPELDARSIKYGRVGLNGLLHSDEEDGGEVTAEEEEKEDEPAHSAPWQEAVEPNAGPQGSSVPYSFTESPEQIHDEEPASVNAGTSLFLNAISKFRRQAIDDVQEDNASSSTEKGLFKYDQMGGALPAMEEDVREGTPVASASEGKAKKDSKTEGLMEEDGVSLKDFAVKPDDKKSKGMQKLSIKEGSTLRPQWR